MPNPLDLPEAKRRAAKTYKDPPHDAEFLPLIVGAWARSPEVANSRNREMAVPGRRVRASWAGIPCDLAIRYLADEYRLMIGTLVHDMMEKHLPEVFPLSQFEVKVDLIDIGLDGSATIDILLSEPDLNMTEVRRTLIELKTVGGYQFKIMAAPFRGGPMGPRLGAVHQAALSAEALKVDKMVVGYLSTELISEDLARKMGVDQIGRFTAEWHYGPDEIKVLAREARNRFLTILAEADAGVMTDPRIWDNEIAGAGLVIPQASGVVRVGQEVVKREWWGCDYCRHKSHCEGNA